MNNEIKQRWVSALRSGEYEQCRGLLRRNNQFCCLGVLCDLYGKEKGIEWVSDGNDRFVFLGSNDVLPAEVVEWAGLPDHNPDIDYPDRYVTCIAGLNDHGADFEEIADVIEVQL